MVDNGETISFADYMRRLGHEDYEEPDVGWDTVIYTINPGETLTLNENLNVTYGDLPVGEYVSCAVKSLVGFLPSSDVC